MPAEFISNPASILIAAEKIYASVVCVVATTSSTSQLEVTRTMIYRDPKTIVWIQTNGMLGLKEEEEDQDQDQEEEALRPVSIELL